MFSQSFGRRHFQPSGNLPTIEIALMPQVEVLRVWPRLRFLGHDVLSRRRNEWIRHYYGGRCCDQQHRLSFPLNESLVLGGFP